MKKACKRFCIILMFLSGWACPSWAAEIRTLIPDFYGHSAVGKSVATILDLQLWRTLRAKPGSGGSNVDLGTGTVFRLRQTLENPSHSAAEKEAKKLDINAQLVLWGKVFEVGDEALVTPHLTLADYFDFRKTKKEKWNLTFVREGEEFSLTADVPQRRYEFEPLSLPSDFVQKYSTPGALKILKRASPGSPSLGHLGRVYRHCGSKGNFACVTSKNRKGWVHLPQLGKHKPEIVDFVGAIVRIYRGDWQGSIQLFNRVIENKNAPVNLVIDSHLYIIRAKSELNLPADKEMDSVLAITFPSRSVVQYLAMNLIQRCFALPGQRSGRCSEDDKTRLSELVLKNRALFQKQDPWFERVKDLVGSVR